MSAILHFTESLGGGVLTSIQNTTQAQIESDCKVTLIYLRRRDTPKIEDLMTLLPGRILIEIGKSDWKGYVNLSIFAIKAIRKSKTDLFHAHSSIAGVCIRLVNTFIRSDFVYYTPHGYAFLRRDTSRLFRIFTILIECLLNLISNTKVISCGKTEALDARKLFAHTVLAETNYLSDTFTPATNLNERTDIGGNILKVASIGRITPQKGPDQYVRIVKKLPPQIKAKWIGGGTQVNPISSSGLEVTGWLTQNEVRQNLREIDVLLMTSQWEGLSMVGIEALSYGVPILSSNYHGVNDLVLDGYNGFICNSDDEFIRNLLILENNRKLLDKLKENARSSYLEKFDLKILADNWKKMYD
jgi:glycosyltransferase involved in cell wall biosynthesis